MLLWVDQSLVPHWARGHVGSFILFGRLLRGWEDEVDD
jgi:hypothetical protein